MRKIKKGDTVKIIAGKSKGFVGQVTDIVDDGKRVIVAGANIAKKHVKPNPNIQEQGGIKEIAMPLHISNVAIYNQETQQADRVGFKLLEDGRKVRIFKSNQELIEG